MSKTRRVMLPIEVSDSNFCFNLKEKVRCPNFLSVWCKFGFTPIFDKKTGNFFKDDDCKNLIWEENIR